jgi:hypothetical protein
MGLGRCMMTWVVESKFTALKILCAPPVGLSPTFGNHWSLTE